MSRHKFVKTLNLDDELEDYDGGGILEDDEGMRVGARDVIASSCPLSPDVTDETMKMIQSKIKVISLTF